MTLPTYNYRPSWKDGAEPQLRSVAARRARQTVGGTYFRSREPGRGQNNISLELIEITPTTGPDTGEAYLIITNHNVKADENVIGQGHVQLLNVTASFRDYWVIRNLNAPAPQCTKYSISVQIRNRIENGPPYDLDLDPDDQVDSTVLPFRLNSPFIDNPKLVVQIKESASNFAPEDVISITPRVKIYRLKGKIGGMTAENPAGIPVWDIADLRTRINDQDPWIEMPPRSGSSPDNPTPTIYDVQDEGVDAISLTPFAQTFLEGGDGLPDNPAGERTGPYRSLIHLNYRENNIGEIEEVNVVYEWVGDTVTAGSWRFYS
jgi:hypothetical protein